MKDSTTISERFFRLQWKIPLPVNESFFHRKKVLLHQQMKDSSTSIKGYVYQHLKITLMEDEAWNKGTVTLANNNFRKQKL